MTAETAERAEAEAKAVILEVVAMMPTTSIQARAAWAYGYITREGYEIKRKEVTQNESVGGSN